MQDKIQATYRNGIFVPILNGEDIDLPEETTVELTLKAVRTNGGSSHNATPVFDKAEIENQMYWLKKHRDEYAGQYVALDGDVLVGHGATIREAHEQAKQNGVNDPFLTRIFSEETVLSGGL